MEKTLIVVILEAINKGFQIIFEFFKDRCG